MWECKLYSLVWKGDGYFGDKQASNLFGAADTRFRWDSASFLFDINAIILGDDCRFDLMLFRCCLRIRKGKEYFKLHGQIAS